jgi:hypothetical protein
LRFEIPGLQTCIVLLAGADLCPPAERNPLAVAKPIDDRYCSAVVAARAVADIDDKAVQAIEVSGNRVQSGPQVPLLDAFQLENPDVANGTRTAIVKHPGLALFRPTEGIVDQSLVGRSEEPFDLPLSELLPESRFFLRSEIPLFAVHFGFQLNMPVIQRVKHPAQNIEEFIIAGLIRHFRSIGSILLVPIDTPQPEERVSLVKGLP